jgi:hypothetical protein
MAMSNNILWQKEDRNFEDNSRQPRGRRLVTRDEFDVTQVDRRP